jgi:MFS family permease
VGITLLVAFIAVELRASEPILPLRLFRNSIFRVANSAALVIGACRLTVTIYIPVFMQGVLATSATNSGVVLIPFMLAWIASGILAGQTVSRTGRYRVWPISGSITSLIGFAVLSGLVAHSSPGHAILCMVLIGSGMGQMFQTYVVAMQNAVPRSSLGIATASIQFCRTIGSMFGAAVFGSILTRRLATELSQRLGESASNVSPGALLSGTMRVADVPPETAEAVRASLASALHTAFLGGLPLMAVGLVAAFLLKELPLRTKSHVEEADEQRPPRSQSPVPEA